METIEPQDKVGDAYFKNKISLSDIAKTESTDINIPPIKVNKEGWTDKGYYQKNKNNKKLIGNTQNYLINQGFEILPDSTWGNQTYRVMNDDLVNSQLDNYKHTNFTEDEFLNQIYKESGGDNSAVSPAGAMGIAQFTPETWEWVKDKGWIPETAKITDPAASTLAQRRYMDHLFTNIENVSSAPNKAEQKARTFAAYNMGPTKFNRFWNTLTDEEKEGGYMEWYKALDGRTKDHPIETRNYVLWNVNKKELKEKYPKVHFDANWLYDKWRETNPKYRY